MSSIDDLMDEVDGAGGEAGTDVVVDDQDGGTRWRRFGAMMALGLLAATGVGTLVSQGALAASFTVSGQQFKVSADTMDGTGFVNYGSIDGTARNQAEPVAIAAMKTATLHNMCQSVVTTLPLVGDITLVIHAGQGGTPVTADNLFVDMTQMNGDATFTNIEIGNDASKLNKGPSTAKGQQDMFAQQADTIHVDNLRQVAWASNAGVFRLNGMNMSVQNGKHECF
jgi:hypothetical protein